MAEYILPGIVLMLNDKKLIHRLMAIKVFLNN